MKLNWAYLKKPSVIIGAIVLFFVVLFFLNRSGSTGANSASTQTVTTGPSDAQVAAQTQLAMAQISAGLQGQAIAVDFAKTQDQDQTQIALATVAAAANNQSLAVQQEIADRTVDAQTHGLDLQYQTAVNQNATALAAEQSQLNEMLASQAITANTQIQLGNQQLQAFQTSTDATLVASLAGRNKYSSIALPAYFSAQHQNDTSTFSQVGTVA
jgi:beta-mannanase